MSAYSDLVIADGATSYLRLDEASGNNVNAVSGAALDTSAGSPTYLAESYCPTLGTCMEFASAARYGNLGSAEQITTKGTFEQWIYPTATGDGAFVSRDTYGSFSNGPYTLVYGAGDVRLDRQNNSDRLVSSAGAAPLDTWTYVVFTVDGLGTTNLGKVYINGALDAGASNTFANPFSNVGNHLIIGAQGFTGARLYFTGRVEEVALYKSVVLSAAQILAHYEAACDEDMSGDHWSWG